LFAITENICFVLFSCIFGNLFIIIKSSIIKECKS